MVDFESSREDYYTATLKELESLIQERRQEREFVNKQLNLFTNALFSALQSVVIEARERGLTEMGEPRLVEHPAGGGRRALQIPIEDWSVIFVPLVGNARPNIRDEAQIPGTFFKQNCGRMAVFIGNEPDSESFYDFLILPNGSWFAWGYGWPRQAATIEETEFKPLAAGLIASFMKDIFRTWRTRDETVLGQAMDARKRAFVFGLPGDET
ncbi:MAG: hypothetical protein K8L99_02670 [Anaerolineae bacterium]|nr:hypothetical protein [Anaerolineae bacterium]